MTDPGFPCNNCGVNAWTPCKHRPAQPRVEVTEPKPIVANNSGGMRKLPRGAHAGYNFRTRKFKNKG
jgi:hypothetical protein